MRNLKRALSLTLASVMLLGMMVVGSSAVGYSDVTEEENIEAIEVLQAVGVMSGVDEENFNPDGYVTREQMAVIMSKLLNLDYNYYEGTNPFSDVPSWAAKYVAACAANGITSGIGGGMYGAGQNVNAVQAALMMLKALGYFQYQQDFGDDYVLATVKQATEIGLFKQIDSKAEQALTRNEVAQMALNALQADLVRFTGDPGVEYTGSNGESWVGGYKSEYTPRTSTDPKYNRLIDNKHSSNIDASGQYYCQLGEELYDGQLVKRYDSDIFERPSFTWTYKTEKIGTYVDREKRLETYTKGVTGRDLYDLLNNITIRDYDLEVYVDGHKAGESSSGYGGNYYDYAATKEEISAGQLIRSNTSSLGATGDGVVTEVFLDRDKEIITIVSIHTWLAQATSAYNATRESATMKVYLVNANGMSRTVNVADVPEVEGVTADSFYLVQMSDKDTQTLEVVNIDEPEILADSTITQFSNGKKDNTPAIYPTELTTGGTKYKDSDRSWYDADTLDTYDKDLLATNTYNVYLDKYGYFIGIDLCEGTKQYVFVTGYDMRNSNLSVKTAEASGIFLDGTMESMTVNVTDTNKNILSMVYENDDWNDPKNDTGSEGTNAAAYYKQWGTGVSQGVFLLNRWYTYTKNEAGVYTLKPCVDKDGKAMMLAAKTPNNTDADNAAETDGEMKLNCAKLRLDGINGTDAALLTGETMKYVATGLTSHRAYGEDASVFITAKVDKVSGSFEDGSGRITRAITDVNGVYTGVQDVDIITRTDDRVAGDYLITAGTAAVTGTNDWSAADPDNVDNQYISAGTKTYLGENAYAVYDKNNFIIGAVILGEAVGGTKNYAYITDPVIDESYRDGTYFWKFKAIMNGEEVTLDAKSKFQDTIDTMRNNWHGMVELRFTDDVVTDVEPIPAGKIYGNPFSEISAAAVDDDNETIYDVVLTGPNHGVTNSVDINSAANTTVQFANIFRGDHKNSHNEFDTTQMGYLYLQGRTLWVLSGQGDHGIDFIRDAKAAVIQPENGKEKIRSYASVQEAIDSLGDPITGNDVKEFYGIISAALNSQGVAEWVVFYSNTNVVTQQNTGNGQAVINVNINVKLPGASAMKWTTQEVPRPPVGNIATINAPSIDGFVAKQLTISIIWSKDNDGTTVEFEYDSVTPDRAAVTAAKNIVDALTTAEKTFAGQETVLAAGASSVSGTMAEKIEDLIDRKLRDFTDNGGSVSYTYSPVVGSYTPAVNGTKVAPNGTAGTIQVVVGLSQNGESTISNTLTFTALPLPYAQTAAGIANAKIDAAEDTLKALVSSNTIAGTSLGITSVADTVTAEADARTLVENAIDDLIDGTGNGLTITVGAATNAAAYVAPDSTATPPANGSVKVKITIANTDGTGTAADIDDVTVTLPHA